MFIWNLRLDLLESIVFMLIDYGDNEIIAFK